MNIVNSKSLIKYNTFKINVKSDYFVGVRSVNEISEILDDDFLKSKKLWLLEEVVIFCLLEISMV